MGAAFSPTLANIFMSVILRRFLATQTSHPLLLKRYIDDVFILWQHGEASLVTFLSNINNIHPNIRFKYEYFNQSSAFLDLMIYKSSNFQTTGKLDTSTFQKAQNLYQYLHFSSNHPKQKFKAIIIGECMRYARTSTTIENYHTMTDLLEKRLLKREYPRKLIKKTIKSVSFNCRHHLLHSNKKRPPPKVKPPMFKCLPPPNFSMLKKIILQHYKCLQLPSPRFLGLKHRTLSKDLVRAQIVTDEKKKLDIHITFDETHSHSTAGCLPPIISKYLTIKRCKHPTCCTCPHLCSKLFSSTRTNKT